MKQYAKMRYLKMVCSHYNINLDHFYCITFWGCSIGLQGSYNAAMVAKLNRVDGVKICTDDNGYVKINLHKLEITLT